MITVQLNGDKRELIEALLLPDALREWGYDGESFAVASNENFVPRSHYQQTRLCNQDLFEVVSPLQGG